MVSIWIQKQYHTSRSFDDENVGFITFRILFHFPLVEVNNELCGWSSGPSIGLFYDGKSIIISL